MINHSHSNFLPLSLFRCQTYFSPLVQLSPTSFTYLSCLFTLSRLFMGICLTVPESKKWRGSQPSGRCALSQNLLNVFQYTTSNNTAKTDSLRWAEHREMRGNYECLHIHTYKNYNRIILIWCKNINMCHCRLIIILHLGPCVIVQLN